MQIDGITVVRFSDWDGLPIKNHLPVELQERMKTANQWMMDGYILKPGATPYEMHPSVLAKKTCVYYLDSDAERVDQENDPKNCSTCSYRKNRWCDIAGDYVKATGRCSEWAALLD